MVFEEQNIKGLFLIKPEPFIDNRGLFRRVYCLNEFKNKKIRFRIKQTNISENNKIHTLRGFHYLAYPYGEDKIISCIHGKVFQVVVDLRIDSPSYLNHDTFLLSGEKQEALLIPKGCGNAFLTLSDLSIYGYALRYSGGYPDVEDQETVKWNDPKLNIKWPIENPILSRRDTDASPL